VVQEIAEHYSILLSIPLLLVIWSYPGQGYSSAAGHFMWLVWSLGTVSHCTFIPHLHYQLSKTCSRHIFSHLPTSLTNCFTEYEQRTLYGGLVVTLAMLLRLIKLSFYYYYYYLISPRKQKNGKDVSSGAL